MARSTQPGSARPRRLRALIPGSAIALAPIVLLAGIGASLLWAHLWSEAATAEADSRLDAAATERATMLQNETRNYANALMAEGAFMRTGLSADGWVSRRDFRVYVAGLDLQRTHPGMQAMGWQVPVTRAAKPAFLTRARGDGHRDFSINPPGDRAEYWVVLYNEPAADFGSSWGFDARLNESVRPHLARSRDSGQPALSGKAVMGSDMDLPPDQQPVAFGLFVPVYRAGAPIGDVQQRRAAFLGWASSPFRAKAFLQEAFANSPATLGVELYDTDTSAANKVSSYPDGFTAGGPDLRTATIAVGGRTWILRMSPAPGALLTAASEVSSVTAFLAGLAFSLLLAGMVLLLGARTRTVAALARSNQANSDLVAMLSHDVKQPLTSIIGYTETVLDEWEDLSAANRSLYLERSLGAAHRIGQLVDEVLTVGASDGSANTNHETVPIRTLLAQAMHDLGIQDGVDTAGVGASHVTCNPSQLRQVLTNLLGNALKYGATPIRVSTVEADHTVEISIVDSGKGVPPEFVPHLFDRFTRANTGSSAAASGTGLGLHIARTLAEANAGQLDYRADPGGGACFVLRLRAVALEAGREGELATPALR